MVGSIALVLCKIRTKENLKLERIQIVLIIGLISGHLADSESVTGRGGNSFSYPVRLLSYSEVAM